MLDTGSKIKVSTLNMKKLQMTDSSKKKTAIRYEEKATVASNADINMFDTSHRSSSMNMTNSNTMIFQKNIR